MPFVLEPISESDIDRVKAFNFREPFSGTPARISRWPIDRQRDAFLVCVGGSGRRSQLPAVFALVRDGAMSSARAYFSAAGDVDHGYVLTWDIEKILMPERLQPKADEVMSLLKEAIAAYGLFGSMDKIKDVRFALTATPIFDTEVKNV